MAGKCCIGGTARKIVGGKAMVGGTVRNIAGGKTMVGGTVYDITFQGGTGEVGELTVQIRFDLMSQYATGGIHFVWGDGSQTEYYDNTEITRQVSVGDEITVYSFSDSGSGYSELFSGDSSGCDFGLHTSEDGYIRITSVPATLQLGVTLYG